MSGKTETIRLFGLTTDSIVDGPGYRAAIFTQGCPHHCQGCHNPGSHDPAGGTEWTLADVEKAIQSNPMLDGVTLTGGEPFMQAAACAELARRAHARGLSVWTFSGCLYETLLSLSGENPDVKALLDETDVLVDGPFVLAERSLELLYCGSRNQRVIDLRETRQRGAVALYAPPEW